jgi:hypothetical protein
MTIEEFKKYKLEYLSQMSISDLAYWLIHSFSPSRFNNPDDYIKETIELLVDRVHNPALTNRFVDKLWAMHGMEAPSNVVQMKRKEDA